MEDNSNPFLNLVNEFESSLKLFISIYNVELTENKTNYDFGKKANLTQIELNKKTIEQSSEELYQKARNLELMFLKYRLDILKSAPEQLIQEDISCLKAELKRKEELLNDTKRKITFYENSLKNFNMNLDHQVRSRNEIVSNVAPIQPAYLSTPSLQMEHQPMSYPGSVQGGQF